MYNGKRVLGLIAARGGSKGLRGKNIRRLLGKPLIAWTIEQALTSRYLDGVVVSTDNDKIANVSLRYGAKVPFKRPKHLARDESPIFDTILHAIDSLKNRGEPYDIIVLLECTSPMRYKGDIDNVVRTLVDKNADSVIGVVEVTNEHPLWCFKIAGKVMVKYISSVQGAGNLQRQRLEKAYLPYSIYATWVKNCASYRTFCQPATMPYILRREQKVDIDDKIDFFLAECIIEKFLKR